MRKDKQLKWIISKGYGVKMHKRQNLLANQCEKMLNPEDAIGKPCLIPHIGCEEMGLVSQLAEL